VAKEVDIVLESPSGDLVGLEVKAGGTVEAGDFRGLRAMAEQVGKRFRQGVVLYSGQQVVPFDKDMHAVPAETLWHA
jgi:hypothetical protein